MSTIAILPKPINSESNIRAGIDASVDIDLIKGLLTDIKLELVNSKSIADILIQDSSASPRYLIRQDAIDQTTGTTTTTILNLDGTVPSPVPVAPLQPVKAGATNQVVENLYIATVNGTGYAVGNSISNVRILDGGNGNLVASLWYDLTSGSAIAPPPPIANLKGYEDKVEELLADIKQLALDIAEDRLIIIENLLNTLVNLRVTPAMITSGVAAAVIPTQITDVPGGTITSSVTSDPIIVSSGISYQVDIPVAAISGIDTKMLVLIQESQDLGINWQTVYTFEPIVVAKGIRNYKSAILPATGNRIRYVQTITGDITSISRSIHRIELNQPVNLAVGTKRSGGFNLLNTGFDLPLYGRTRRVVSTNRTANLYFWQFHDSATALVTGAVPLAAEVYQMPANSTVPFTVADLGEHGTVFGVNPRLALSTTFATYTPVSAVAADSISIFVERL